MVENIIEILKSFEPLSIFLYGSNATKSTNSKSDFEIGIIFEDLKYVSRSEIQLKVNNKNYNVFPFKLSEIQNNTIDTPFQKNIYMASLICGNAKTIFGEVIIENLKIPKISKIDLLMDTSFCLGRALSAVALMKENIKDLANEIFYKSLFFATRNLFYAKFKVLLSGYNKIFEQSKKLDIPEEFRILLILGNKLRNEEITDIDSVMFYKNVSYINKFIIPAIENSEV